MTALLAVLVGGMAGAVARQELFSALQERARTRFPVGILVVNLSGAFVLGLLFGLHVSDSWPHWLATGVQTGAVGAYTTYSTWAVDSLALARVGSRPAAVVNLAGSLVAGVLLAWAGASLGSAALRTTRGGPALQVIVGVDGSAQSVLALTWACRRAQTCGDVIRAICTWSMGASGEDWTALPGAEAEGQRRAEGALQAAVDAVRREHPAADIETLVVEGPAAHVLVQMSADADQLVVGSRGLGGFKGLLLGSVSIQCVHHSRCPVTVVRESDDGHLA